MNNVATKKTWESGVGSLLLPNCWLLLACFGRHTEVCTGLLFVEICSVIDVPAHSCMHWTLPAGRSNVCAPLHSVGKGYTYLFS